MLQLSYLCLPGRPLCGTHGKRRVLGEMTKHEGWVCGSKFLYRRRIVGAIHMKHVMLGVLTIVQIPGYFDPVPCPPRGSSADAGVYVPAWGAEYAGPLLSAGESVREQVSGCQCRVADSSGSSCAIRASASASSPLAALR